MLVGADGRIVAVGPEHTIPTPPGTTRADHPGAVLLPGLINLHTHLELTGFEGMVDEDEFPLWIRALRELKATRSPADYRDAARRGIEDCFATGVTTIADTGDSGAVLPAVAEVGGSGVIYQEVFGPHPDQVDQSVRGLEARLAELAGSVTDRVRLGVSPHAPYTVSGPLYRRTAELARAGGFPLAVHLAESRAETQFVTRNEGPFADAWRARGIPPLHQQLGSRAAERGLRSPVAWLDHHGVLGPTTLCIHTVELDSADLDLLADRGVGIAHCPLSNARHGHGSAPLEEIVRRRIRVGVGTDSVVSVGRLDLLAELRAARDLAGLGPSETLALATTEAARVLGLEHEIGRLAPGWFGDCVVIEVPPELAGSPVEAVLEAKPLQVVETYLAGRSVYRRGPRLDSAPGSILQ